LLFSPIDGLLKNLSMAEKTRKTQQPTPPLSEKEADPFKHLLHEEAVILLTGTNMLGQPIFSYVKLTLAKFRQLRDVMLSGENFIPAEFGEIVESGIGEPSSEVVERMRKDFHMVDMPQRPIPEDKLAKIIQPPSLSIPLSPSTAKSPTKLPELKDQLKDISSQLLKSGLKEETD
jgi:hypothetical protein